MNCRLAYRNILFDLDGTLTDSGPGIIKSVQYALTQYGLQVEPALLQYFIGPPLQDSFINYFGFTPLRAQEAVNHYRDYYREQGLYDNRLYPGLIEMLRALKREGANLFIATSKPTIFARQIAAHFSIEQFFRDIVGSNLDGSRVAKTEVIETVFAQNRDLTTADTVMVGDREHDLIGARNLHIDSIAVTYGYGTIEELKTAKPNMIANSIAELTKLLIPC